MLSVNISQIYVDTEHIYTVGRRPKVTLDGWEYYNTQNKVQYVPIQKKKG